MVCGRRNFQKACWNTNIFCATEGAPCGTDEITVKPVLQPACQSKVPSLLNAYCSSSSSSSCSTCACYWCSMLLTLPWRYLHSCHCIKAYLSVANLVMKLNNTPGRQALYQSMPRLVNNRPDRNGEGDLSHFWWSSVEEHAGVVDQVDGCRMACKQHQLRYTTLSRSGM